MNIQITHAIGGAIYFVFFILFLLSSRVPRTNPGAGWWAAAILAAFLARILIWSLSQFSDTDIAVNVYSFFVIAEKLFLLIGLSRFFGEVVPTRWIWTGGVVALLWVGVSSILTIEAWLYNIILAAINCISLSLAAVIIFKGHADLPAFLTRSVLITHLLLVFHWLLFVPVYFFLYYNWKENAFLMGTILVLMQYLSLLSALFSQFQQRLMQSEEKAIEMAYQDPLTGLNNKRYVDNLFEKALLLATRPHQFLAVLYLDLDKFKPINDTAGHKVGDLVLQEVAKRLKSVVRSTDICARLGGDEFAIIITQLESEEQTKQVAEKLLQQLEVPILIDGNSFCVGASIGVSLYPTHGTTLASLLECADRAMYQVKTSRQSGYALFEEGSTS